MTGPLTGYKILELGGVGPGPFAGMMLTDMGAYTLRIDRPAFERGGREVAPPHAGAISRRGRKSVGVDLKHPMSSRIIMKLVEQADGLIEGYRPGAMERLGLGPDDCFKHNKRLIYARMTGWGQDGPYAQMAGHDINYVALSGTLSLMGIDGEPPTFPLNLVGDYGGGGMMLAFGMVCGLLEAAKSGEGQVIDAAMVDGSALLASFFWGMNYMGTLGARGTNTTDGGAPYYNVYETKDGKYISLGAIEPDFYQMLLHSLGLLRVDLELPEQNDPAGWSVMKQHISDAVKLKTQQQWCDELDGTDVCFAPITGFNDIADHPHIKARQTVVEIDGVPQPAPAPRFSRTPGSIDGPPPSPGAHTDEALSAWGFPLEEIAELRSAGAIY